MKYNELILQFSFHDEKYKDQVIHLLLPLEKKYELFVLYYLNWI